MKRLSVLAFALIALFAAAPAANAQVVVAPPVPVVGYYAAPLVRFTPGYYFGPARLGPAPRVYSYRQRVRGPYYRGTLRVRGW